MFVCQREREREREKIRVSVLNEEFHVTTTAAVRMSATHGDPSTSTRETPSVHHKKRPSDTNILTKHICDATFQSIIKRS